MSNYTIQGMTLTKIADAIREKDGTEASLTPAEMPDAIMAIQSGSQLIDISTATVTLGPSLTYNGDDQTQTVSSVILNGVTLTENKDYAVVGEIATDAGDHTMIIFGVGNYTGYINKVWTMNKATGSISVSPTSLTIMGTGKTGTSTITKTGDGSISVSSNATSVATASVSGTTVTVTSQGGGSATITVTMAAGTNYTGASCTISVTVQIASATLNDNSWEIISSISEAGQAANYWSVGDRKAVTLSGTVGTLSVSGTYYVYIIGINHNSSYEGTGIHFGTFKTALSGGTDVCLIDSYYNSYQSYNGTKYFQMNHWGSSSNYNTNYGGWSACDMRYDILGSTNVAPSPYGSVKTTSATGNNPTSTCATSPVANTLMAALPSDLRAVMKPITKYTDNKGNASNTQANVTATQDYLPLLSEFEVQGTRSYANQYEQNYQAQYDYYKNGNSKVKYGHNSTSSAAYWWVRSAYSNYSYYFCYVSADGGAGSYVASFSSGLAPALKI